jgi:hypothetical protein
MHYLLWHNETKFLPTRFIYVFCVNIIINRDYFDKYY